jgi:20S proteasome subunit alpha 1
MRAYAVELIFFSYDEEKKAQLFKVDPAGHFAGYFATASGVRD